MSLPRQARPIILSHWPEDDPNESLNDESLRVGILKAPQQCRSSAGAASDMVDYVSKVQESLKAVFARGLNEKVWRPVV